MEQERKKRREGGSKEVKRERKTGRKTIVE